MRLHDRAGDRTTALRQYARCVRARAEELDVEPSASAETVALHEQIRTDREPPGGGRHDPWLPFQRYVITACCH
jgi:DNA-binding SARP family transcriptional activator